MQSSSAKQESSLEIVSIHVPKTAGTSFYKILKLHYGDQCYPSVRRKDAKATVNHFRNRDFPNIKALHGHLTYKELKEIINRDKPKVIAWLRDPIDRVISNFNFFKAGLSNPERNPRQYELNKHRKEEGLMTYARRSENRNVMSAHLGGFPLEEFYFLGIQERFRDDMEELREKLGLRYVPIPLKNIGSYSTGVDYKQVPGILKELEELNQQDLDLYQKVLAIRKKPALQNIPVDPIRKSPFYMNWEKEVIFIHLVKTGGTSIRWSLGFNQKKENSLELPKHLSASEIQAMIGAEKWERAFKFSFVRNPWDRLVSYYHYRIRKGEITDSKHLQSFESWLLSKAIKLQKSTNPTGLLNHIAPQVSWLKNNDGKIDMDFIGRFESFEESFSKLCEILDIKASLESKNINPNKVDYRSFYTESTRNLVKEIYWEDIDAFDYSF